MIQKIIPFISYKLIWFSGVWGSTIGIAFLTPILTVIYAYWIIQKTPKKGMLITYISCISIIGIISESLILNNTAYQFLPERVFIPYWLMAIWVAFPCLCVTSLKYPLKHPVLAIGIGAIFGPLAYQGAASLGNVELINGVNGIGILSLVWGAILFMIHRWIKILPDY